MKNNIFFILVLTILTSCSYGKSELQPVDVKPGQIVASDSVISIKVNVPQKLDFNIDDLLFNVKYIPLETNRQSLIGEISKVIYYKERFYILDYVITNSIFIFDKEGNYIDKISRTGRGPGEYGGLSDFDIDRYANEIVLFTEFPIKIIRNTLTGEFISESHPPCFASYFTPLQNKASAIFLQYRRNIQFLKKEFNLIFVDSTSTVKMGVLDYDHSRISEHFYKRASVFYNYRGHPYFYPTLNDSVYKVGINQITPVYAFDFGENSFKKDILQKGIKEQDKYFLERSYASIFYIFETDNVLNYFFACNSMLYRGYYSKLTGKTITGAICTNKQYPLGTPIGNTDDMLIDQLSASSLYSYNQHMERLSQDIDPQLYDIIKNYKETDNPVLVTYQMEF